MQRIGRYQIQGELGRGAMGVVFRALDPAIGRTVAIKTIRLADFDDPTEHGRLRERLLHEARSAGILSHPGIVTVYDVGEEGGLAYIAMEFVNGPSLEQMLTGEQPPDGNTVLRVLREMAAAIDFAHRKGIVHRDIKPANVMIHEDGTVKITDFGVAKIAASHQLTQAGTMLGTPNYMSPEQVQGKPVDGRSDVFSLAVIAYEMLTGEKPFAAEQLPTLVYKIVNELPPSPHLLNPSLSWQVEVVLRKALEKDPQARYATCGEFVAALEGACNTSKDWKPLARGASMSLPTVAAPAVEFAPAPGSSARRETEAARPPRRSKKLLAGMALALAAVAAGAGVYLGWFGRAQQRPPATAQAPVQPPAPTDRPSPAGPATPAPAPPPGNATAPVQTAAEKPASAVESAASPTPPQQQPTPPPKQETAKPVSPRQQPPPQSPKLPAFLKEAAVFVNTSPPGANVIFDGDASTTCKSPCSRTLSEGRHTAAASLPGHRSALKIFQVPKEVDVLLYLARMTGQVQVLTTPPGASVLIEGERRKETTPTILELPVGSYTVTVEKEGYKTDQQAIEVKDNAFLRLDFQLGK